MVPDSHPPTPTPPLPHTHPTCQHIDIKQYFNYNIYISPLPPASVQPPTHKSVNLELNLAQAEGCAGMKRLFDYNGSCFICGAADCRASLSGVQSVFITGCKRMIHVLTPCSSFHADAQQLQQAFSQPPHRGLLSSLRLKYHLSNSTVLTSVGAIGVDILARKNMQKEDRN